MTAPSRLAPLGLGRMTLKVLADGIGDEEGHGTPIGARHPFKFRKLCRRDACGNRDLLFFHWLRRSRHDRKRTRYHRHGSPMTFITALTEYTFTATLSTATPVFRFVAGDGI